ncbi:MAG TPA: hypothetical protein VGK31_06200 [Thermoanaerobaculia bacterium]
MKRLLLIAAAVVLVAIIVVASIRGGRPKGEKGDATHVAIVSGIKNGDSVVTGPFRTLKKLRDGDSVIITKEEKRSETAEKSER